MAEIAPEDFNAGQWFGEQFAGQWRYDHVAEQWHVWNGTLWAPDVVGDVNKQAFSAVRQAFHGETTEADRKALLKLLNIAPQARALQALAFEDDFKTDGSDWDQDPNLIGTDSGIVDLRIGKLVEATPEQLITRSTGAKFLGLEEGVALSEYAPEFMKALMEWTSGDTEQAMFLLLWFGSSLFGVTPEQRFMLMTGTGRNGKGALKHAILQAVGEYGTQPDANLYMRSRHGAARSDAARADLMALKGKRITFFSEPSGGRFDEELLKSHTGGDIITARALYSNAMVSWAPTHSITFLTNELPEVDDVGPSMAARVMVTDFRERFDGDRENKKLYDLLTDERDGILTILVNAARLWYKHGLELPERVVKASEGFISTSDPVANALNDAFVVESGASVSPQVAYDTFCDWYRANYDREPMSQVKFSQTLERKGFKKSRTAHSRSILGLRALGAVEQAERDDESDD
jgi:putative DNA primase/helicase